MVGDVPLEDILAGPRTLKRLQIGTDGLKMGYRTGDIRTNSYDLLVFLPTNGGGCLRHQIPKVSLAPAPPAQSRRCAPPARDRAGTAGPRDHLQAQTWGVWLHEAEDGTRHVVAARGDVQRGRLALDRARTKLNPPAA